MEDTTKAEPGDTGYGATIDDSDLRAMVRHASAPQYHYKEQLEKGPVHRGGEGHVQVMSRAAVDEVFQNPKVFSSAAFGGVSLGR